MNFFPPGPGIMSYCSKESLTTRRLVAGCDVVFASALSSERAARLGHCFVSEPTRPPVSDEYAHSCMWGAWTQVCGRPTGSLLGSRSARPGVFFTGNYAFVTVQGR